MGIARSSSTEKNTSMDHYQKSEHLDTDVQARRPQILQSIFSIRIPDQVKLKYEIYGWIPAELQQN